MREDYLNPPVPCTVSGESKKEGEIEQQIKMRDLLTGKLHAAIDELADKISPVLREVAEKESSDKGANPTVSKIGRIMSDQNAGLELAISKLYSIKRRVEL